MSAVRPDLTVAELTKLLTSGAVTPEEVYDLREVAIARHNRRLNSFITVFTGRAGARRRGGPLRGITLAVKDNIYVKRHQTTAGSRILRGFVPLRDAEVVTRLTRAGAMVLGKTNLHEFAFGVTNINPHYGDCRNPWKPDRVSGGSSGGSAVAVAQGMACAAVGTDTAGSVRIPASLCGVVGYKPTNGLISRRGVVPLAWSLDTVGFLTRGVEDAALLASLASEKEMIARPPRPRGLAGLRIGVPRNLLQPLEEDVGRRYEEALASAEEHGAKLVHFDLLHIKEAVACRNLIVHSEAASYHRRYFSRRYNEYGADVRQRLAQGMAIPAFVYLDALRARGPLIEYYRSIFRRVDLLASPTTRISAPTIKASKHESTARGIRASLLAFTEPFNVYGAPAISMPCGLTREGLPVGLQLAGDIDADERLLSAAASFEMFLPRVLGRLPFGN